MQKLWFDNFVKRFALACLLEYSDPSILSKLRKRPSFPLSVSNARQSQGNNDECAFRGTRSPFHGPELNTFRFCPKLKINMKCEWLNCKLLFYCFISINVMHVRNVCNVNMKTCIYKIILMNFLFFQTQRKYHASHQFWFLSSKHLVGRHMPTS